MTPEQQLALVERHYALNAAGNHAAARELLTDDFLIEIPHYMPFAGAYRGKDAFLALIPRVRQAIAVKRLNFVAVTVGAGHAVELVEFTLDGHDGPPVQVAEVIRFRGDKIAEIRPYYHDPEPMIALAARRRAAGLGAGDPPTDLPPVETAGLSGS
ncbi:MAG: nuclear transport factor 2 family protein [Steroidobacteraceae bacterium]|nr:nuclear transport factor 2 family protein [Planctomycetota bacterium]MCP5328943.1 nuclear transport factor 2 family protein [Nevskiaceae bacterium]MCP5472503.1 nuclear transport factor 2 family protein [Nevskiaceae bacterium]